MALTEEELAAYGRSFKEFFDRVGRTGIFDLPSDISSDSDGACTPTGLLTPSREDHGMARFTKLELVRERRPPRPTAAEEAEAAENQRLAMVRKVTAEMALHAPDYFTNLDRPGEWIIENHGIRYDWKNRTLRSKKEKEPYLFAMDDEAGLVAITSVGHDFWPEDDKPVHSPHKERVFSRYKYRAPRVTKWKAGRQRASGYKSKGRRRMLTS